MRNNYQQSVPNGGLVGAIVNGWYVEEGSRVNGFVTHDGDPWDIEAIELLPQVFPRGSIYAIKIEIDDTGTGKTSWFFSFRKAELGPKSVRMDVDTFWDKVSMSTVKDADTGRDVHYYCGVKVEGIEIHFAPFVHNPPPPPAFNPGGPL